MSLKVNNTKPSGTNSTDCDAGIPIMGRTAGTGTYEILKVNPDGSLPFPAANNILNDANAAYIGISPTFINIPFGGVQPPNTYVGIIDVAPAVTIQDGLYNINPTFLFTNNGTNSGGISFILYKIGSIFEAYISTLPQGATFNPSMANVNTGIFGYWHNTVNQQFGVQLSMSYNRTNTLTTRLTSGYYSIAIITDGSVGFVPGTAFGGFYEFTKIG